MLGLHLQLHGYWPHVSEGETAGEGGGEEAAATRIIH